MENLKVKIEFNINFRHFEDIIVTAMEGGSNYWYHIDDFIPYIDGDNKEPATIRLSKHLFNNPLYKLEICDKYDLLVLGTLTQASILKAIELASKEYLDVFHDLLEGTGDAGTADILFQLAVMGKVIFG